MKYGGTDDKSSSDVLKHTCGGAQQLKSDSVTVSRNGEGGGGEKQKRKDPVPRFPMCLPPTLGSLRG